VAPASCEYSAPAPGSSAVMARIDEMLSICSGIACTGTEKTSRPEDCRIPFIVSNRVVDGKLTCSPAGSYGCMIAGRSTASGAPQSLMSACSEECLAPTCSQ